MYNKLTRKELKIIEETRKEGTRDTGSDNHTKKIYWQPYLWFLLVFILCAILFRFVIGWLS